MIAHRSTLMHVYRGGFATVLQIIAVSTVNGNQSANETGKNGKLEKKSSSKLKKKYYQQSIKIITLVISHYHLSFMLNKNRIQFWALDTHMEHQNGSRNEINKFPVHFIYPISHPHPDTCTYTHTLDDLVFVSALI